MVRTLTLLLLTLSALTAAAQSPAAEWRTIETEHFRVHYPREYEQWSMRAAERLESIRLEVSKEIGFTPPQKTDVLVTNPIAEPNGSAWPFLDSPRMIFYAEAPGPDEQLGAYGHWIDLLAVHEIAHLVHMLRPTRNPLGRAFEKFVLPLNPITLRAPRWVLEGYATVIEGRLTGAGRPTSTIRALILRRWAENGRLPAYGQLNSDRRFLGMSMAYLMGSAYLEWLEQRAGPDSLRNLWSRMTARQRRSFDEAFIGVYGESPERLYGRFTAELTASAVAIDRASRLQEGELFQETSRASGDPAVSPDGKQLAVVIRQRDQPEKLVIWSTAPPDEEEKKFAERLDRIFGRDPEDVRPVRSKPLPRKAVHELVMPDGGDIESPRWMRDGKAILFTHRARDAEGFLHTDLYRWDFERVTRVTHLADVRDADPLPDGRTATAVRSRYGLVGLVDVDLATGAVTPLIEPSIDEIVSHPRVSPDGERVAYVAHRGGSWVLVVEPRVGHERDVVAPRAVHEAHLSAPPPTQVPRSTLGMTGGEVHRVESVLPSNDHPRYQRISNPPATALPTRHPERRARDLGGWGSPGLASERGTGLSPSSAEVLTLPGDAASPEWLSNDELIVTLFTRGFAELHRIHIDGTTTQITRSAGGAFDPAPSTDGRIFFTSLNPDGYVVRALPPNGEAATLPVTTDPALVPAIPPPSGTPVTFASQQVTSHPYGFGRQEFAWFTSTNLAPEQKAFELGVRFGDVVGRLDTIIVGSLASDDAPEGGAIATAWRGWPVEVQGHLFTSDQDEGLELRGLWTRRFTLSRLTVEAGALSDDLLFGSAAFSTRQVLGASSIEEGIRVELDDEHYRAVVSAGFRSGTFRIAARYQHDGGTGVTLGGIPSTILPRSAYAHRILDPALPVAILRGDEYDGWRVESTVPGLPFTAFYQRHELGAAQLSMAGAEVELSSDPMPILKFPGLDLTLGGAYIFDAPLEGETKLWLAMRWRP